MAIGRQSSPRRNNERIEFLTEQEKEIIKQRNPERFQEIMEAYREYMEIESNLNELETRVSQNIDQKYEFLLEIANRRNSPLTQARETAGRVVSETATRVRNTSEGVQERIRQEREILTNGFKDELGKQWYGSFAIGLFDMISKAEEIKDESLSFDNFFTKAGGAIAKVIFELFNLGGYKKFKEAFDRIGTSASEITQRASEGLGRVAETARERAGNQPTLEEQNPRLQTEIERPTISLDTRRELYYKGGIKLLVSLDIDNYKEIKAPLKIDNIKKYVGNLTYSKLLEVSKMGKDSEDLKNFITEQSEGKEVNKRTINGVYYMIQALTSDKVEKLIRYGLTPQVLKNMINRNKNLENYIDGDLGEILTKANKNPNTYFYDLTVKQISILYSFTVPTYGILGIQGIDFGEFKNEIIGMFKEGTSSISEIGDMLLEDGPIPPILITSFYNTYKNESSPTQLGGPDLLDDDLGVKNNVSDTLKLQILNDIYKREGKALITQLPENSQIPNEVNEKAKEPIEVLDDIISFKNFLMSDDFLDKEKIGLLDGKEGESKNQKDLFKENLDYKWVIILYNIMYGNQSLDELSPASLPFLILTIGNILGTGGAENTSEKYRYLGNFGVGSIFGGKNNDVLNDGEQAMIDVFKDRFIYEFTAKRMEDYFKYVGLLKGSGLNYRLFLASLGLTGAGMQWLGNRFYNNAHNRDKHGGRVKDSPWGRRLGMGGRLFLWGALIAGVVEFFSQNSNSNISAGKDFTPGSAFLDIGEAVESGNTNEVRKVFERLKSSTYSQETPKGPITIVGYNRNETNSQGGDSMYALYDDRLWRMGTVSKTRRDFPTVNPITTREIYGDMHLIGGEESTRVKIRGVFVDFAKNRIEPIMENGKMIGQQIVFGERIEKDGKVLEDTYIVKLDLNGNPLKERDIVGGFSKAVNWAIGFINDMANSFDGKEYRLPGTTQAEEEQKDRKFIELYEIPLANTAVVLFEVCSAKDLEG